MPEPTKAEKDEAENTLRREGDNSRMGEFERAYFAALTRDREARPEVYTTPLKTWQTTKRVRTILETAGVSGFNWSSSVAAAIAASTLGVKENTALHWEQWLRGEKEYAEFITAQSIEVEQPNV